MLRDQWGTDRVLRLAVLLLVMGVLGSLLRLLPNGSQDPRPYLGVAGLALLLLGGRLLALRRRS